jgi:V8-like Glu-specific endopeptidase
LLAACLAWFGSHYAAAGGPPETDPYTLVEFDLKPPPADAEAMLRAEREAEAATVGAATVFPPDERIQVTDTTRIPFRTVADLGLFEPGGRLSGRCSGVMLGPDVVLTAAHCVYWSGRYIDSVLVVPGESWPSWPYGTGFAVKMAVPNGWASGPGQDPPDALMPPTRFDWAILVLSLRDWNDNTLAPYPVVAHAPDAYFGRPDLTLFTAGYPGDKPVGTMWAAISSELAVDDDFLYTRADIAPGQSGSPIFAVTGDHAFIFSVVSGGNSYANRSVRFTPRVLMALEDYARNLGSRLTTYIIPGDGPTPTPTRTLSPTPTRTPTPTPTRAASPTPSVPPTAATPPGGTPNPRPFRLTTQQVSRD